MRFTKKDATDIAREIKDKEIYTVVIVLSGDLKVYDYMIMRNNVEDLQSITKKALPETKVEVLTLTSKEVRGKYPEAKTIKALQHILYTWANREIQRVLKRDKS